MLDFAYKSIMRQRTRTLLTTIGILIVAERAVPESIIALVVEDIEAILLVRLEIQ